MPKFQHISIQVGTIRTETGGDDERGEG